MISEFKIPVPWGYVAAKAWGDPGNLPVLLVHGIQDNAGSFDRLIPLLPTSFYYVCIDLPGHGRSSHYPDGVPIYFMNFAACIKRIVDFLKWDRFYYIGHSLGAYIGTMFAGIFPDQVIKLVLLDATFLTITSASKTAKTFRALTTSLLQLEDRLKNGNPPVYTYDEALKRLSANRISVLLEDSAKVLLERSLVEREAGYSFSFDQKLKLTLQPFFTCKQQKNFLDNISAPVITVFAKKTYAAIEPLHSVHLHLYSGVVNYKYFIVEGDHDVHINYPERVAPYVSEFLISEVSKL